MCMHTYNIILVAVEKQTVIYFSRIQTEGKSTFPSLNLGVTSHGKVQTSLKKENIFLLLPGHQISSR